MSGVANVFLIGAAKAGTTALAHMLGQHPNIASMAIKEPGHFCTDIHPSDFSERYHRLLQWDEPNYFNKKDLPQRHIGFVQQRGNYHRLVHEALKSKPQATHVLDASTAYLYSKTAAKELAHYNNKAKVIVILRDPVDRAFSHYTMALKYGMENASPLEAFKREAALERAQWGRDECFLELGKYDQQISTWMDRFSSKHLLILLNDDLKKTPQKVMQRITEFLDLPTFAPSEAKEANIGSVPKYPKVNAMGMRVLAPIREKLPKELVAGLKKVMQQKAPDLDPEVEHWLKKYYSVHTDQLEMLTNLNLTHWK